MSNSPAWEIYGGDTGLTATPEQIEAAKAALEKFQRETFNLLWEKVQSHVLIGGATKTFLNPETGNLEIEAIAPEDLWQAKPTWPPKD